VLTALLYFKVRFDFVLDADLNLYLMEANMSPNLSSKHFALNRMLYEQVLYSLLRLNGILRGGIFGETLTSRSKEETEMQVWNL
jgi:tubulin monoglycylase TTLL15